MHFTVGIYNALFRVIVHSGSSHVMVHCWFLKLPIFPFRRKFQLTQSGFVKLFNPIVEDAQRTDNHEWLRKVLFP